MANWIEAVNRYRPRVTNAPTIDIDFLAERLSVGTLITRPLARMVLEELGREVAGLLRTGHKAAALLTLVGDGAKGWLGVFAAQWLAAWTGAPQWTVPAAALAVFLGHLFPAFHGFKGGKGVATAAGIVFALSWPLGLALAVVWATMAYGFRISSLAALTAALLLPLGAFYVFGNSYTAWAMVPICVLLFWRHRANIRQLFAGRERTIGR